MNNIYLIGMPGCGKSAIGKILSADLKLAYIDADEYLEEKYNTSIPDIFELEGETIFRQKETEVIKELSLNDNTLISTGGGVVVTACNKDIIKNTGLVIFIDCCPETILSNSALDGRPLLKDKNKIFDKFIWFSKD